MVKNRPDLANEAKIAENPHKKISRSELVSQSTNLITQLSQRLSGNRFIPRDGDSVKLGYIRAMLQALQVHNTILRDEEIAELAQRVEMLEKQASEEERFSHA